MRKFGGMLSAAELGHYAKVRVASWELVSGRQFSFDIAEVRVKGEVRYVAHAHGDVRDIAKVGTPTANVYPVCCLDGYVVHLVHGLFKCVLPSIKARYGILTPKPSEWCRSLQNFSQCVLTVHPVAVAAALIDQPEHLVMGAY